MAGRFFFLLALPALADGAAASSSSTGNLCIAGSVLNTNIRPIAEMDNRTCSQFQNEFFMQNMTRERCLSPFTLTFSVLQGSMVLSVAEASVHLAMPCCNATDSPCAQYLPMPSSTGMCPPNFTRGDMGKCFPCNGTLGFVDPTQGRCVRCNVFETEGCRDSQSCTTNQGFWDGSRCLRCSASNPRQCPAAQCSMYGGRYRCYNPDDPSSCQCQTCTPTTSGDISGCGEQWCKNTTNMNQFSSSWQCWPNSTNQMSCECGKCCAGDNCNDGGSHWACDQARCSSPNAPDLKWMEDNFNGMTWGRCTRCVNMQNGPRDTQACMSRAQCTSIGAQWTCTSDNQRGCCQFPGSTQGGQCTSLTAQDVQRVQQAGWVPVSCSR